MPDPAPATPRSWFDRLSDLLLRAPQDQATLLQLLSAAQQHGVIDADALSMIRGVLQVSQRSVRDIMIPFSQIDMVNIRAPIETWIGAVLETGHSRFPAFDNTRDHISGILLAKDLLHYYQQDDDSRRDFNVRDMLRPAVFVPESKPLNVLLRDFRDTHNHLALVVDEYSNVIGMATIEDVIEQIVGEIEDEYDFDDDEDHIVVLSENPKAWRVKGLTELPLFNQHFGCQWHSENTETLGGFIANHLGHVPHLGEKITIESYTFEVGRADGRQVDWFHVQPAAEVPTLN